MIRRTLLVVLFAATVRAEELPPAPQILAAARAQLPAHPVVMSGTLKERASNGFVKKVLSVEMELDWNSEAPRAEYRIKNPETGDSHKLEIVWFGDVAETVFSQNREIKSFNSHDEIENTGVTWSDLSFSFLWNSEAQTLRTGKKLGRNCYVIAIPRPESHTLLLWVEKETGRLFGAEEQDAEGNPLKIIKVVSVKEFDGLWMVKDLDIIHPRKGGRTSLRVNNVEAKF